MIDVRHKQRRFGIAEQDESQSEPPGDCWTCCLATILQLPYEDVPNEMDHWKPGMTPMQSWRPYMLEVHDWLANRGLMLVEVHGQVLRYSGPQKMFNRFASIAAGPSPRNPKVLHAVVCLGNQLAFDPHPSDAGLLGDPANWDYEFFVSVVPG